MEASKSNGELQVLSRRRVAARLWAMDWPESLQPWLEQLIVFMTLLSLAAVLLRVYSRRLNHMPFWVDDWLAIGNLVCSQILRVS